jgi:glycosyltransferase involved in cell wall biosynthesis
MDLVGYLVIIGAMSEQEPLVSVVVPAYNAASTIGETLLSVLSQTYRNLEVLVVDDGSTDETAAVVQSFTGRDQRVRLIQKPNGGVASARNAGIAASNGEFVAFIDADDLWHPTKIRKQVSVLVAGGPEMGLVYTAFRSIDSKGLVVASSWNYAVDGWVPFRHFQVNLVGNGSAVLVRKSALEAVGGYATWLREANAEGCEDLLLQLRIARSYRFGTVPEYLVGYRKHPGNMSADVAQMTRSRMLVMKAAFAEYTGLPGLSMQHMLNAHYKWHIKAALKNRRILEVARSCWRQFRGAPQYLVANSWEAMVKASRLAFARLGRRPPLPPLSTIGRPFYSCAPDEDMRPQGDLLTRRALSKAARLDARYQPKVVYPPSIPSPKMPQY